MFSEHRVVYLLHYKLSYAIPQLGRYKQVEPGFICFVLLLTGVLYVHYQYLSTYYVTTLRDLVMHLLLLSTHFLSASMLVDYFITKIDCQKIFSKMVKVGTSMNATLKEQKDWLLDLMAFTYPAIFILPIVFCFVYSRKIIDVKYFIFVAVSIKLIRFVVTKHLIAKRLRYIRSADEYLNRIEDTITHTRQLLNCNTELNQGCQLMALAYAFYLFNLFQCYFYTAFAIHGVGVYIPDALENDLLATTLAYLNNFLLAIQMGWSSSFITEEVNEIKLELDATCTARPCNEKQRKLIRLFLMELHHTPIHLSAMGLFDIDNASFSSGFCIVMSYLLVLIQFTS